jgi:hypothetical protein
MVIDSVPRVASYSRGMKALKMHCFKSVLPADVQSTLVSQNTILQRILRVVLSISNSYRSLVQVASPS